MREDPEGVSLEPSIPAVASVIWLHGLGASGQDFVPIVPELGLPSTAGVRFVFPHAPVRPVTLNQGYRMRAWYDIQQLRSGAAEDAKGIEASATRVGTLIRREADHGVAYSRIVLAGFSQGGALAPAFPKVSGAFSLSRPTCRCAIGSPPRPATPIGESRS